ncbi:MAG TPA: hypothetical protein PKK26_02345 [Candidatus Wallbacteria bacterium]|nr:hypothetical protein [Candidatus Wallbacteria bacterium]
MTTNKIFDDIFYHDSSDGAIKFKNNFKSAITSYISNPTNPVHIRFLNSVYWDMLYFIIKKKFMQGENREFAFNQNEKIAIDFGYISDSFLENAAEINIETLCKIFNVSEKIRREGSPVQLFSITEWLVHQLKEFTGVYTIEKLEKTYENSIFDVDSGRQEKERFVNSKRALLEEIKKEFDDKKISQLFTKVCEFTFKIDDVIDKYAMMKSRIQMGLILSPDERVEFVGLENIIKNIREERKKIFRSSSQVSMKFNNDMVMLEDMIIQKEHEIFDLISMIGKNKNTLENFIFSKNEIVNEKKDWFLKDKLNSMKNNIIAIFKNSKVEPMMFLTKMPSEGIVDQLFEIIRETSNADPGLFTGKFPAVSVIIVPGRGKGDYNHAINALVFPQVSIRDYRDMVVSALALYRWESDLDFKLRNSFSGLKSNKVLTPQAQQQAFIKNYALFITKELKGVQVLDFDIEMREWFVSFISSKNAGNTFDSVKAKLSPEPVPAYAKSEVKREPLRSDAPVLPMTAAKKTQPKKLPGEFDISEAAEETIKIITVKNDDSADASENKNLHEAIIKKIKSVFNTVVDNEKVKLAPIYADARTDIEIKGLKASSILELLELIELNNKLNRKLFAINPEGKQV